MTAFVALYTRPEIVRGQHCIRGCPARFDRRQEAADSRGVWLRGMATATQRKASGSVMYSSPFARRDRDSRWRETTWSDGRRRRARVRTCDFVGVDVGVSERHLDAPADLRVSTVEALGVDPEQDLDRVPSPLGHHGGRYAAVEPGGHGRVPKGAGRLGQGRGGDLGRERGLSSAPPPLRSPMKSRRSGWTPNSWMWAWSRAVSGGGQGTRRTSPRARCLSGRWSRVRPLSGDSL